MPSRLPLIDPDTAPDLARDLEFFHTTLGFVPNNVLTMLGKPELVKAYIHLNAAVMNRDGEVDLGFKRLIGHVASRIAYCPYCEAQTLLIARFFDVSEEKVADVWTYATSPHYTEAERVALDFAVASAQQPNQVTDALFHRLRQHWRESQIIEILGVIGMFGFLTRWASAVQTPLEPVAVAVAHQALGHQGWRPSPYTAHPPTKPSTAKPPPDTPAR